MGGVESKTTQVNLNRISINNKDLENPIENVWKIESYGNTNDANPTLLQRNEKKP